MSVNKVILLGRLGKDAVLTIAKNGNAILNASLATTERYKDKEGKWIEKTEWHRIAMFGKRAEGIAKYLLKGAQIYLEGKLVTTKYTDKAGIEKYSTDVIVNDITLLGGKPNEFGNNNDQLPEQFTNPANKDLAFDEIPF